MKNYEKYADEIRGYKGKDFCKDIVQTHILGTDNCNGIDCQRCAMLQILWLLEDYKEPEVDWSKVAVDTPILVSNSEDGEWIKRYFAEYKGGFVYAWNNGGTSWTAKGYTTSWRFAKLAETEGAE